MSGAVLNSGLTAEEPKLEDLFNQFARKLKIELNCVKIGTIQTFNAATMTASIQIVFQQALRDGTYQNVPLLTDCPVVTPQGGGYSLQFPIAIGDTALVFFADRNIDNWFQAGGVMPAATGRLHALSDAVALVGLNSLASPLSSQPPSDRARLIAPDGSTLLYIKNGDVMMQEAGGAQVEVTGGLVGIRNSSQSLATILNAMLTTMSTATTVPEIAAAAGTAKTALAALLTA